MEHRNPATAAQVTRKSRVGADPESSNQLLTVMHAQVSLVHQRSSESHDSATSGMSLLSTSSGISNASNCASTTSASSLPNRPLPTDSKQKMQALSSKKSSLLERMRSVTSSSSDDDYSMTSIWKRAFNIIKAKDKNKSLKKVFMKIYHSQDSRHKHDDSNDIVDPVYSLLKSASEKSPKAKLRSECGSNCNLENYPASSIATDNLTETTNKSTLTSTLASSKSNSPTLVNSHTNRLRDTTESNAFRRNQKSHRVSRHHWSDSGNSSNKSSDADSTSGSEDSCGNIAQSHGTKSYSGTQTSREGQRRAPMQKVKSIFPEDEYDKNVLLSNTNPDVKRLSSTQKKFLSRKKSFSMDTQNEKEKKKSTNHNADLTRNPDFYISRACAFKKDKFAIMKSFSTDIHVTSCADEDEEKNVLWKINEDEQRHREHRTTKTKSDSSSFKSLQQNTQFLTISSNSVLCSQSRSVSPVRASSYISLQNCTSRGEEPETITTSLNVYDGNSTIGTPNAENRRLRYMKTLSVDVPPPRLISPKLSLNNCPIEDENVTSTSTKDEYNVTTIHEKPHIAAKRRLDYMKTYSVDVSQPGLLHPDFGTTDSSFRGNLKHTPLSQSIPTCFKGGSTTPTSPQAARKYSHYRSTSTFQSSASSLSQYQQHCMQNYNSNMQPHFDDRRRWSSAENNYNEAKLSMRTVTSENRSLISMANEKQIFKNIFVAVNDFYARQSEEINLSSGNIITGVEMSDAYWWKGKHKGNCGYFPARCVRKIHSVDYVYRVVKPLTLVDEGGNLVRLLPYQVVIKLDNKENEAITILVNDKQVLCPLRYLEKVYDY